MSQQRTSRAEFTRKAGTPGDLATTDEVRSAGTYPSSAARNTPDKRVGCWRQLTRHPQLAAIPNSSVENRASTLHLPHGKTGEMSFR